MALKLNIQETQFGVAAPEAYARITNIYGTKDQFQVQVAVYYNQTAREQNMTCINTDAHYIAVSDLSGDIIPAIYNALKTLPQYAGAEDC